MGRTLYVMNASQSYYQPAFAFLDEGLAQNFVLGLLNPAVVHAPGMYVLECTPMQSTPAYRKILLYVDGQTSEVRRALVLDAQGNKNRFEFGAPTLNQPVPAGAFKLAVPPGTTVVPPRLSLRAALQLLGP
jgi:outer membrane lipoprotein carrier protein